MHVFVYYLIATLKTYLISNSAIAQFYNMLIFVTKRR